MNYLKLLSMIVLFSGFSTIKAQDSTIKTPDKPANCKNIKSGKFLRDNYPEAIWYMTIEENVQTEYFNNGKDFIKSALVFVDDCNYKAIVLEKSDKSDPVQAGDVFNNKIVETEGNFLKVYSKIQNEQIEMILVKVNKK